MSKFMDYKTVYLDEDATEKELGEKKRAGYYVFHLHKKTAGPYENREGAITYIGRELLHERMQEIAAAEQQSADTDNKQ